ncbi:MAG: trypsin-like serine protease, partial [Methylovulum sp.]|nr:trypsin-like serine protease [Methylovulum sp.]
NAIPMPLPIIPKNLSAPAATAAPAFLGVPGFSAGHAGDGKQSPTLVPKSSFIDEDSGFISQEFGTQNHPYTTSLVNLKNDIASKRYPNSATGKLYFNIGSLTYVCSASLIKPGVIVTAAHCVASFGNSSFYSNWLFVPALDGSTAPYGQWTAQAAWVKTSYYNGTDSCAVSGVVCTNDVAVITLAPINGKYAGNKAGWYSYGWNGYSYASFLGTTSAQISQLGYPQAINSGTAMLRTDSLGYVSGSYSNNTVIGSLQTGGSSGGPWLVNLGMTPSLSGTNFGSAAKHNVVVGVTSWGYTSDAPKEQGASPFTSNNIVSLVNSACPTTTTPGC